MRRILLASVLLCAALCGCGSQSDSDPRVREILSAPVPEGINPVVWRDLTERLAAVVEQQSTVADAALRPTGNGGTDAAATGGRGWDPAPAKSVSIPPTNSASATTLSYDDANGVLHWPYYFSGDYDQNGVVSVSDLTPLAVHLGESVSDANSITGVIDGDNNGEITVADLTPIGVNLGKSVQGYRVYSAVSAAPYPATPTAPNGTGTQLAGEVLLAQATGNKATQRLQFSFDNDPPSATTFYWVRPYDGADDGTPSNLVTVGSATNQAPVARLSSSMLGSATPLRVNLSAQTSTDDHGIVKYEWDLDGDSVFEYDSGDVPTTSTWFYAAGTFTVAVRVTDAEGLRSTSDVDVEVTEGAIWHTQEVASIGNAVTELVVAAGNPALFYNTDETPSKLVYRRATNDRATSWQSPVVLADDHNQIIRAFSATLIGDKPAVVFSKQVVSLSSQPAFRVSLDAQGSTWSDPITFGPEATLSDNKNPYSLVELLGKPALAYAAGRLHFLVAADSQGVSWSDPLEIGIKADDCHLGLINGTLGVAFYRETYDDLLYVSAFDPAGTIWGLPTMVDDQGAVGEDVALINAGGVPALAYYDDSLEVLRFVRANAPNGSSWSEPQVLASQVTSNQAAGVLPDGRLAVCFRLRDGNLNWIVSNDSAGSSWGIPTLVASGVQTFSKPSFIVATGTPYVAFAAPHGGAPSDLDFSAFY